MVRVYDVQSAVIKILKSDPPQIVVSASGQRVNRMDKSHARSLVLLRRAKGWHPGLRFHCGRAYRNISPRLDASERRRRGYPRSGQLLGQRKTTYGCANSRSHKLDRTEA